MTFTTGDQQKLRLKSGRKPLQPINSPLTPISTESKPKAKQQCTPLAGDLGKENNPISAKMESLDASLAEELSAIRKKLERLRLDKDKTDKMLNERDMMLDMQMKELQRRGEIQKLLEIEVDRLYRLKELKCYCLRISSIRSLREKEQVKIPKKNTLTLDFSDDDDDEDEDEDEDEEESIGENDLQSPCPSYSELVSEKEK